MILDITKAQFRVCDAMRYDTPGDYYLENGIWIFEVWSGLSRPEYIQEVFGHELQEAMILVAAGVTPKMIDTIDAFRINARLYAIGQAPANVFAFTCIASEKIPRELRNLYDQAHFQAILWGRTFIDACGLDWKQYEAEIEGTRGKIPIRKNPTA